MKKPYVKRNGDKQHFVSSYVTPEMYKKLARKAKKKRSFISAIIREILEIHA